MVSVIVLAAGSSRRMGGSNKLLLPWKNSTLIQHAVEVCMESCADEVLVVLGHHSSRIKNALWSCPVQFVENPLYEQGMLTSIQAGIRGASPESEGWIIFLSDQPRMSVSLLNELIESFRMHHHLEKDLIVLPVCDGIRRNPVLFSRSFRERLLNHRGDRARELVRTHENCIIEIGAEPVEMFEDVDTLDEYEILKT